MKKKFIYLLAFSGLIVGSSLAVAQSSTVTGLPSGVKQITLLKSTANWFSIPLTGETAYTGVVSSVTASCISISGKTNTFSGNLATAGAPYFVQFLTGAEVGRTMLIKSNTTTALTLDTTDGGIGSTVALNTSGYCVAVGDSFRIFAGDTLASVFGAGTTADPVVLAGGTSAGNADQVMLCGPSLLLYYYNTKLGYWVQGTGTANANNTVIYPFSAVCVNRTAASNVTLLFNGQITPVKACTKVAANTSIYGSTHYATGVTLAQMTFGSNWVKSALSFTADNVGIWNPTAKAFTFYYQQPNGNWYLCSGGSTTQNTVAIPAGSATVLYKRTAVAGATSFLVCALPYTP